MTITDMPVTLATAGLLGLYYMYLSARVVMARGSSKVSLGDGSTGSVQAGKETEAAALMVACRAHGNFMEYVPLALILMGGIESAGASHFFLLLLALLLIVGRILHPLGLSRVAPNPFRAGGAALTWLTIILASLDALRIAL
jgi:uncharacterized membrane protein YecN with MAPEG domain